MVVDSTVDDHRTSAVAAIATTSTTLTVAAPVTSTAASSSTLVTSSLGTSLVPLAPFRSVLEPFEVAGLDGAMPPQGDGLLAGRGLVYLLEVEVYLS